MCECDDHARVCPERVLGRERLRHDDVEHGAADPAVGQCGEQRLLVDQAAASDVDDAGAGLERAELGLAEQVPGGRVERRSHDDVVADGEHLVHALGGQQPVERLVRRSACGFRLVAHTSIPRALQTVAR